MYMRKTIGFCYVKVYCMNCGYEEGYNGCYPLSSPISCKKCGGIMVHNKNEEENIKNLEKYLKEISEKCKKYQELS
jgi:transcription initiation factor IIE alpha subunit